MSVSCKKEPPYDKYIESEIVLDSLVNSDGAHIYYHLQTDNASEYKISWINPPVNQGTGPFLTIVQDPRVNFKYDINGYTDSTEIDLALLFNDPSKYKYDYRDALVGNYYGLQKYTRVIGTVDVVIREFNSSTLINKSEKPGKVQFEMTTLLFEKPLTLIYKVSVGQEYGTQTIMDDDGEIFSSSSCRFLKDSIIFTNFSGTPGSGFNNTYFNGHRVKN